MTARSIDIVQDPAGAPERHPHLREGKDRLNETTALVTFRFGTSPGTR